MAQSRRAICTDLRCQKQFIENDYGNFEEFVFFPLDCAFNHYTRMKCSQYGSANASQMHQRNWHIQNVVVG